MAEKKRAIGDIQIDEIEVGTILKDPTIDIVGYYAEVVFEGTDARKHSRMIKLPTKDIDIEIAKHKLLKKFK